MEADEEESDDLTDYYGSLKSVRGAAMGTEINELTKRLIEAIQHDEAYDAYETSLNELKRSPELYNRTCRFRAQSFKIQNSCVENVADRLEYLMQEFKDVLESPAASRFLTAEQKLCRLMDWVLSSIGEAIDLDICFMDKED